MNMRAMVCVLGVLAATSALPHDDKGRDDKSRAGELVRIVRDSTARFRDPAAAEAEGYQLQFGCVTGPDLGAMGLHYVNMSLVGDGALDATRPEIVIYEPLPNGRLRLIGADYLVLAADWHAKHAGPPQLEGQLLHLFESLHPTDGIVMRSPERREGSAPRVLGNCSGSAAKGAVSAGANPLPMSVENVTVALPSSGSVGLAKSNGFVVTEALMEPASAAKLTGVAIPTRLP